MERKLPKKKKTPGQVDLKTSTINLFLNIIIFLLAAVIIYMSYSLFIKFGNNQKEKITQNSDQEASEIIQVEVLNGCGVSGVGERFTDFLRNNGFDVVNMGNYISYDVNETLVIDRIGNMANAYKVAKTLGVKEESVIQQLNNDYFLDVSIVIGRDYYNLQPLK